MDILELSCSSTLHNLIKSETCRVSHNQFAAFLGTCLGASRAQMVKNLPSMQEIWVPSLNREDPLEKGDGYPLQHSCLENSMDRGAW